jgi:hypothetical protein
MEDDYSLDEKRKLLDLFANAESPKPEGGKKRG